MASQFEDLIRKAYVAFNRRDIDAALSTMHPAVEWPKAFEGGYVCGHDEIRSYWTRQWTEINPHVEPVEINERPDGTLEITVHQIVKDLQGNLMFDGTVKHVYILEDELLRRMDIETMPAKTKQPESIVPILYSNDVRRSIAYYTEVLGFPDKWEWEDPPTFGGVNWGTARIFFCEKGQGHPGTWLALNVENVDEYYESIKAKGADIIHAPEDKPWAMREMLVRDTDGHIIRFGHGIECD